jgi:hypothetical protein
MQLLEHLPGYPRKDSRDSNLWFEEDEDNDDEARISKDNDISAAYLKDDEECGNEVVPSMGGDVSIVSTHSLSGEQKDQVPEALQLNSNTVIAHGVGTTTVLSSPSCLPGQIEEEPTILDLPNVRDETLTSSIRGRGNLTMTGFIGMNYDELCRCYGE